ncbi:MAG: TerC family protein [Thiohalocapsa sp.]|uniref:TerC family protein n=1 Tax=Thiohalocapsa sp. TaxID=2497641 RepID=UPI0025FE71F0|nr:TerC family protein [Thiohalocapsa sp.]MCG6939902.1 TerC family protein [Thiohalocapsa sp.]
MHELALADGGFWVSVLQIIAIDILLGGDNAVVIALACRRLPQAQRNQGILWGVLGAIALRLVLIFFALQLLALPFLKLVGGLLLLWIGIKLLQPEPELHEGAVEAPGNLLGAVRTIVVADAIMSLDNVIAVAGAADGDILLVAFGIVVSIPIIVWGSKLVLLLMDRFPVIINLGGALLGWIGAKMLVSDALVAEHVAQWPHWLSYVAAGLGAIFVVAAGTWLARRAPPRPLEEVAAGGHAEDVHKPG